ncbi:hypothetical protein J6590_004938 [Homalodisca vitripennis]|nr:hypothetical protein J6590_004938 [Homalodisca vitripennis]
MDRIPQMNSLEFTDKFKFTLDTGDGRCRVWRRAISSLTASDWCGMEARSGGDRCVAGRTSQVEWWHIT